MKIFLKALVVAVVMLLNFIPRAKASLFINEAMMNPSAVSDAYGEWFELYNDGTEAIDINGWIIKDADSNSHTIDNGDALVVPASGYLVLGRNANPAENGGCAPDYVYSDFTLANTVDEIILENGGENIVQIYYDSANWPVEEGQSMAYTGAGDLNNAVNWFATPDIEHYSYGAGDYGTPGAPNVMPEPASMLLMGAGLLIMRRRRKK